MNLRLRTAFPVSHRFCLIVFSFPFESMYLLIFFLDLIVSPFIVSNMLFFLDYHLFFLFFLFLNCFSSTIVSIYPPPVPSSPCIPTSHPHPTPLAFVHVSFIRVSWRLFSYFSHYPSPPASGYHQSVLYLKVSVYILLACLFC